MGLATKLTPRSQVQILPAAPVRQLEFKEVKAMLTILHYIFLALAFIACMRFWWLVYLKPEERVRYSRQRIERK